MIPANKIPTNIPRPVISSPVDISVHGGCSLSNSCALGGSGYRPPTPPPNWTPLTNQPVEFMSMGKKPAITQTANANGSITFTWPDYVGDDQFVILWKTEDLFDPNCTYVMMSKTNETPASSTRITADIYFGNIMADEPGYWVTDSIRVPFAAIDYRWKSGPRRLAYLSGKRIFSYGGWRIIAKGKGGSITIAPPQLWRVN